MKHLMTFVMSGWSVLCKAGTRYLFGYLIYFMRFANVAGLCSESCVGASSGGTTNCHHSTSRWWRW